MPDYFTLEEFRQLPDMDDETLYPDERVESVAAYIVAIIERECGTSFVARTVTDEIHDGGYNLVVLDSPYVLSVDSASENGVELEGTLLAQAGVLRRFASASSYSPSGFANGYGNVKVTYNAGYSATPPADIKEAALLATRARLLETDSNAGIDDRRTSISTDLGTVNYVIAGEDRPTGYPQVDAVINGWKARLNVGGVA